MGATLGPVGGQLPRLLALHVLTLYSSWYLDDSEPGPRKLGLASAEPFLTEIKCWMGQGCMKEPHEQLATLAPLGQLRTIVLSFFEFF